MKRPRGLLPLLAIYTCAAWTAEPHPSCGEPAPLRVRIRMAGEAPRLAFLSGGVGPGLRLTAAGSGDALWSAGPDAGATQVFAQMTASFGSSLAVIDLNGDGIHDRLYAGDRLGRLWRFDLDDSAPADRWASGGVFADLGAAGTARGFVAAPDVALIAGPNGRFLNIAIGTASVREGPFANRFYVLRDHAAFESWNPARYRSFVPLTEADLQQVEAPQHATEPAGPGYFIPLGSAQVLAQSLTLAGLVHFTLAETSRSVSQCLEGEAGPATATLSISVIRAIDGSPALDLDADGRVDRDDQRVLLPRSLPPHSGVELPASPGGATRVFCTVGGYRVESCSLDTSPHRTYWRREDAD